MIHALTVSVPIIILDSGWFDAAVVALGILLVVWVYRFILRLVPLLS